MRPTYRFLRAVVGFLFRVFSHFEIVGLEHVPPAGPLIVAVNHIHMLDSPALMAAMPYQLSLFAARKWERHPLGILLRMVGASFINRGEVDRRALKMAVEVLKKGGAFGIAPEGTRSKTRQLQAARGGVAYLAYLSGAPILPVGVAGVERAIPALMRLRRARVRVTIGEPFVLPPADRKLRSEDYLDLADMVMRRIAELLPPEYRGVYAGDGRPVDRMPAPTG